MFEQRDIDRRNTSFWSELCGSSLARALEIESDTPDALSRFDAAYFAMYPYLKRYVDVHDLRLRAVLEIGLGYGTLGQYIAERGAVYHGIDIAPAAVEMMRHRLLMLDAAADDRVLVGSAHAIPFPAETFDYVFSIGCLHHTGDIRRGVDEIHRVLRPGGTAVVMLYNRYSSRQVWRVDRRRLAAALRTGRLPTAEQVRAYYDANAAGEAAPHTDFTSKREARRMLCRFSSVQIRAENFDDVGLRGRCVLARDRVIRGRLPRFLGLDLYITARK